jgi:hypothetical protein
MDWGFGGRSIFLLLMLSESVPTIVGRQHVTLECIQDEFMIKTTLVACYVSSVPIRLHILSALKQLFFS